MGYMTNGLTFNDLEVASNLRQKRAKKYAKSRTWTHAQYMMAVLGELGELANVLKKVDRGDMTLEQARPLFEAELADVICYLPGLAKSLEIRNLGEIVINKFNEVSKRVGSTVTLGYGDYHVRAPGEGEEPEPPTDLSDPTGRNIPF